MADNKTVIEVEVKGTDAATNSLKNLKKELKEAQAAALNGDGKAAKRVAELKDKLDDLNDSTKTLKGSGIERATASFQLLGEGVRNLDFGPIKTGLAGLRTALASTGILLIVQAVGYLISNFDELTKGSGGVAKALKAVGDVVSSVINFFTDLIGLTSETERQFKKQSEAIKLFSEQSTQALAKTTAEYDRQISVMKANGESTVKVEKAKQLAIMETNAAIIHQLLAYKKAGGELSEEQRKQLVASTEAIKTAQTSITVIDIEENNRRKEAYKKRLEEQKALQAEFDASDKQMRIDVEKNKNEAINLLMKENQASVNEELKANAELIGAEIQTIQSNLDLENAVANKEHRDKELAFDRAAAAEKAKITEQGLKSIQNISDIFFLAQSSKAKKGSAEAEALAKKQFKVNKALQLSMAVMDGYKAITASLAQAPVAIGPIPNPAGIASLAFAVTTSAANVAKILATQYESTSTGGGETPTPSIGSTGETPTITQPMAQQPTTPGTNFDAQGNVIGGGAMKAYVVETEITNKQTTVNRLQSQAEFG